MSTDIYYLVSNESETAILKGRQKMRSEGGRWTSSSPGCETIEDSRKKWGMPEAPCKCCAREYSTNFCEPYKTKLIATGMCMTCNFWEEYCEQAGEPEVVRVGGVHYFIGDENASSYAGVRGFGGRRWRIKFHDGREVISTNLWYQGEIPERFRDRLPDNAQFIQ